MRSRLSNPTIPFITNIFDMVQSLQGSTPLVGGSPFTEFTLPSVAVDTFQTIFFASHTLEDVGSLDVIDIYLFIDFTYKGNGSVRWQVSGDGGNNWTTVAQGNFDVVGVTNDLFVGAGDWIDIVESGNNKFQFRAQGRAIEGAVDFTIFFDSQIWITYNKRVLF